MDPATIALIVALVNLLIKLEPQALELFMEIKSLLATHEVSRTALLGILDGTIQTSTETRAMLAPLLAEVKATL